MPVCKAEKFKLGHYRLSKEAPTTTALSLKLTLEASSLLCTASTAGTAKDPMRL